ncbi:MAG: hypothetical protein HYV09_41595 [Deltaproteobacteria bacterium]|nr:hypothetical protein [Deltaproteobacteria bacterium]
MRKLLVALAVIGALAPSTAALAAPDKQACLAAYEQTQKLRKSGKLLEARKQSLICAQSECPTVVRDDCTSWSVDLEKATPTIVLVVTDAEGKDVTDAKAFVDGDEVASHLDGSSIALNPGTHKLRVERAGAESIERDVVAHEGDKNRKITVKFPGKEASTSEPASPASKPPPADGTPAPAPTTVARPVPAAAWVLGGVGVLGLVGFATFGSMGSSKKSDLDARGCKPDCPQADVDAAKRDFLVADVLLGVGVVSLGVATVLVLTRGREDKSPAAASVPAVDVALGARGGSATLKWTF